MTQRWQVTCDDCPDFAEVSADEAAAERIARAHAGRYHGESITADPAQLVEDNLKFAHWMTRRAKPGRYAGETYDEVLSDALLGLFEAARRFDPSLGFTFATYASRCIWTTIYNGRRRRYKHAMQGVSDPLSLDAAVADDIGLIDLLPDPRDDISAVDDADEHAQRMRWLAGLLDCVSVGEAAVLRLELTGQKTQQIADELGVSVATVRNRHHKAIRQLRMLMAC